MLLAKLIESAVFFTIQLVNVSLFHRNILEFWLLETLIYSLARYLYPTERYYMVTPDVFLCKLCLLVHRDYCCPSC